MTATVSTLLAVRGLGLRLASGSGDALHRPLQWGTSTELQDPHPFLTGDEIVLTTGMRLRSARACRAFVASVVDVGSAAIGFGTGFTHERVPDAIVAAAADAGIPVIEVPYATPFAAITRYIGEARSQEQFAELETLHRQHQQLVSTLLGDAGLPGLVERLAALTRAHVAVTRFGEVLGGTLDVDDDRVTGWDAMPVSVSASTQATLHVSRPRRNEALLGYARSLIGLQLSQEGRRMRDARDAAGQVLTDLIRGRFEVDEVELRLGSLGLAPGGRTRLLVVESRGARASELPRLPLPSRLGQAPSAMVEDRLVVLLPARDPARPAAEAIVALARAAGLAVRVGIGDAYPVSASLRWSYFEALDGLQHPDTEVAEASRLSISALLLASRDVPVRELADEALAPLERHDTEHGSALVATLDSYLQTSGAITEVAAALGTHRNTIRYRLDQIAALTGLDPRVTGDVVQLWLARAARRVTSG
ncbi:purine catabolism regulator [Pseudoclavibacter chungangensis]|nr:PucR family transcriptional regulator ligand-binding domain-containing protein [Pseudoclavibacter chungangensis]NYJ67588.1 purine catabolism regulator [Pseudoclavibacter chungangensis]